VSPMCPGLTHGGGHLNGSAVGLSTDRLGFC
jgi:hypothetical protein